MQASGAQIIVELLRRQGVRIVAGIPGGCNLPLYDALASSDIRHVLVRNEQGAGFLAQGLARVSGLPAVALATSGPGATNLLTAVADARLDSVPLVCITGQVPTSLLGSDAFQEVDVYGMSIPVTKHNFLVRTTEELFEVIPRAFAIAMEGRPGPVLIDVPKDVQQRDIVFEAWPEPGRRPEPTAPDRDALAEAARIIDQAERPILYLGGGVIQSNGAAAARELAEKAGLPTVSTLMGLGAMPAGHPLDLGMLGMHAARSTNLALAECDALIAVGARFDDRAVGKVEEFCPEAAIVHIDVDPGEFGKIKTAHAEIAADARAALEGLIPLVAEDDSSAWIERVQELRAVYPIAWTKGADMSLTTPYGLIHRISQLAGPDAVVVTDVGKHQMWTAQAYPHRTPRRWLTSGGLGTMGFGLPAALGAWLDDPNRPVVLVSGDGSLMMNVQEMATAAELSANIVIVLMDNGSLGLVRQQQELFCSGRIFATRYSKPTDFPALAAAFGLHATDLEREADPEAALSAAFASRGPRLIRVPIDGRDCVYPMVPPGAANTEMIDKEESHAECN
jgi:acetolactate synthase-1/2/3 large subunit